MPRLRKVEVLRARLLGLGCTCLRVQGSGFRVFRVFSVFRVFRVWGLGLEGLGALGF